MIQVVIYISKGFALGWFSVRCPLSAKGGRDLGVGGGGGCSFISQEGIASNCQKPTYTAASVAAVYRPVVWTHHCFGHTKILHYVTVHAVVAAVALPS